MVVPTTQEEYCLKPKARQPAQENIDMDDFYDDDCYDMDDDDDEEESEAEAGEDGEDSGNGET